MKRYAEFYHFLAKTLGTLQREVDELLRAQGVSEPQFNVLGILRDAYPESLSCGDIAARMVSRDPDITRLLDRLERCGFIERRRGNPDRRQVIVKILEPGMELLDRLREPMAHLQERQFASLEESEMRAVMECLEQVGAKIARSPNTRDFRRDSSFELSAAG